MSGPLTFYDLPKTTNFLIRIFYLLMFGIYIVTRYIFRASSVLQGGNAVIRRSALEKIGGYNVDFKFYGDDTDLAHRLAKIGEVKFSFDMQAHTSGRRLTVEGKYKMASRYFINYLWTVLFGKPFTEHSIDVRHNQPSK
ncbi:MAG: hypothetical protein ACD_72C00346G0001 [uncultured bacterium]|nr:MAG: hypothetical protein ACD_72C00346G0001 [uncultured bacterium]